LFFFVLSEQRLVVSETDGLYLTVVPEDDARFYRLPFGVFVVTVSTDCFLFTNKILETDKAAGTASVTIP
jgi:hypothetical protein